ncbi:MAG: 2-C-methyl-D-erythritol 4-phosphate cytidylyltransferase [Rickettsiaceae bacterium H1]|nr:2-C-methyl-D-erythritol 4-phosphate cytidylyltransferase [Rickettsiaceae bacterium H1]
METIALILASGEGIRFGNEIPKQYLSLIGGNNILESVISTFIASDKIDGIQVVINKNHQHLYRHIDNKKLLPLTFGGKRRQDSVCNGLEAIEEYEPRFVLIHDGSRPFVSTDLISRVVNELENNLAVIPALRITDSIVAVNNVEKITKYIKRDNLRKIQTPQGFNFADIIRCHKLEKNRCEIFTDEGAIVDKYGIPIKIIIGENSNIKITFKEDISEKC